MPGRRVGVYGCLGAGVVAYDDVPDRQLVTVRQELAARPWEPEAVRLVAGSALRAVLKAAGQPARTASATVMSSPLPAAEVAQPGGQLTADGGEALIADGGEHIAPAWSRPPGRRRNWRSRRGEARVAAQRHAQVGDRCAHDARRPGYRARSFRWRSAAGQGLTANAPQFRHR